MTFFGESRNLLLCLYNFSFQREFINHFGFCSWMINSLRRGCRQAESSSPLTPLISAESHVIYTTISASVGSRHSGAEGRTWGNCQIHAQNAIPTPHYFKVCTLGPDKGFVVKGFPCPGPQSLPPPPSLCSGKHMGSTHSSCCPLRKMC